MATAFGVVHDISILVSCPSTNITSERRITPTWSLSTLRKKLESVTGVPPDVMRLEICVLDVGGTKKTLPMEGDAETVGKWIDGSMGKVEEITVHDNRPPSLQFHLPDISSVPKYTLPEATYESLTDSVLAWKKREQLGRFNPNKPSNEEIEREKFESGWKEAKERGIELKKRARIVNQPLKVGNVAYVGPIPELPGSGIWVGLRLDEPVGKNDGTVKTSSGEVKRYFNVDGEGHYGAFVRPDKVEIGEWEELGGLEDEEI